MSLILWFVFKKRFIRSSELLVAEPWKSFGVGALVLILTPIIGAILLVTGVLALFGGIALFAWIFTLLFMELALILVVSGRWNKKYNQNHVIWKEVVCIILLAFICSIVSGIDTFLAVFALGALTLLKKELREKINKS